MRTVFKRGDGKEFELNFSELDVLRADVAADLLLGEVSNKKRVHRHEIQRILENHKTMADDEESASDSNFKDEVSSQCTSTPVQTDVHADTGDNLSIELFDSAEVDHQSNEIRLYSDNGIAEWLNRLSEPIAAKAALHVASNDQVIACRKLIYAYPNLASICSVVVGAAVLSHATNSPLRIPNLLIEGPPGCGKTQLIREVSNILNLPLITIPLGSLHGNFELAGGHRSYKSAEPSLLIKGLIENRVANAIFLFDEAELARPELYHPLYAFLEDNQFKDHFLQINFNIEHINIVFICNERHLLPDAIRSRLSEFAVKTPSEEERRKIIDRIYNSLRESHTALKLFPQKLSKDCRDRLANFSLRQARILLEAAMLQSAANVKGENWRVDPKFITEAHSKKRSIGYI